MKKYASESRTKEFVAANTVFFSALPAKQPDYTPIKAVSPAPLEETLCLLGT